MLNTELLKLYIESEDYTTLFENLMPLKIYRLNDEEIQLIGNLLKTLPDEVKKSSPIICAVCASFYWLYDEPSNHIYGVKWQKELDNLLLQTDENSSEHRELRSLSTFLNMVCPTTDNKYLFFYISLLYSDILVTKKPMQSLMSTRGFPSVLRGEKDLSELGRDYKIFENLLKPMLEVILGQGSDDLTSFAVAEILYQKNMINEAHLEVANIFTLNEPELLFANKAIQILLDRLENNCPDKLNNTLDMLEKYLIEINLDYILENFKAFKIRLDIEQGNLDSVEHFVDTQPLSMDDRKLSNLYRMITYAKALLSLNRNRDAAFIFKGIISAHEDKHRPIDICECYANIAICLFGANSKQLALHHFKKALNISRPNGFIRIYSDLGNAIAPIVSEYLIENPNDNYAKQIYVEAKAFGKLYPNLYKNVAGKPSLTYDLENFQENLQKNGIAELSKAEYTILTCLAEGLSNNEISVKLDRKLTTVKFHVKNILSKFKATNRTEAVKIGRELGYLD